MKTRIVKASSSNGGARTRTADPADEESTGENPSTKQVAVAAGEILVTGGVAVAVWKLAHDMTRDAVDAAIEAVDPNAADAAKLMKDAEIKTLQTHGAVKVVGGAGVGIAGAVFLKPGFGQSLTTGAAVGLIVSGGEDLLEANEKVEDETIRVLARPSR